MNSRKFDYHPLEYSLPELLDEEIVYAVKPKWSEFIEDEVRACLYWNRKENRWHAFVSGKYLEGYSGNEQIFFDFARGPFELNDSACRKILESYGIKRDISPDMIPFMSPPVLRSLAGNNSFLI